MAQELLHHLRKFIKISAEDFLDVIPYFSGRSLQKKDFLLTEGQICKSNYFVIKGCLRMYFVNEKGVEQTTQFAIENWWISDYMAFQYQAATSFFIQAVEKTEVLIIDRIAQDKLLDRFPIMEKYFRLTFQHAFAASQMRMKYLYDFSKEELYRHFSTNYPSFIQRIPQYLLASYLGFTPEYLSELRAKIRS
jgi:CRP-like cAMP-binding protein